jgi:hypothetical protein
MANGQLWIIKLSNDGTGNQIINSITVREINGTNAVTGINAIRLLATIPHNQFYIRAIFAPADIATTPLDLNATVLLCRTAIVAKYGSNAIIH